MSQETLPIELKNNKLAVNKRRNKRTIEGVKRVGRIVLSTGVAVVGVGSAAIIGGPVATTLGLGIYIAGATKAGLEIYSKKIDKHSLFLQSRRFNGEIKVSQSANIVKSSQKMKGFKPTQKEAMMGVDVMVALSNMKHTYQDRGVPTQKSNDGKNNVYPQVYSATTHGGNIEMVDALGKLGYLEVQRKVPKKKSSLIVEKIGFGQYKEAGQALLAMFSNDKTKKRQMYDIAVKITDKPIDFEEMYKMYETMEENGEKTEQFLTLRKIMRIFFGLRTTNIDIVKNEIGETIINYNAQESFVRRMKREGTDSCKKYRGRSYIGDQIEQFPVTNLGRDETTSRRIEDKGKEII